MHTRSVLLLALMLTASLSHAAGIYKWIDENGQVHYSQRPPSNTPAEQVKGAPPPADDPSAVREDLQKQVEAFDERRAERDEAYAEQKYKDKVARTRKQNCDISRKNLAKLRQGGQKAYEKPDGEVIRLTDDEREKRIEAAKQGIEENCGE